jgi:cellulose synthase/poly-beta-1,6-N-acetylglucosamine synthase-like glycosyltransferase
MNELSVSVIVPCYNEEENIDRCIKSLLASKYKFKEIIVVDDGSTDGSSAIIQRYANLGLIKCIKRSSRGGPAKAINAGINIASGQVIGIIDGDSYVEGDWIEKVAKHFKDLSMIAVGGPIIPSNESFWERCSFILDNILWKSRASITGFSGTNMAIRREVLKELNFFNEEIRVGEDLDLNIKLRDYLKKAGGKMVFDEGLIVFTAYPKSLLEEAKRHFWWGIGRIKVVKKNKILKFNFLIRVLYVPLLMALIGLLIIFQASMLFWTLASLFVMLLLGPTFLILILARKMPLGIRCRMGVLAMGYVRLFSGSLGSIWGLIKP